MSPRFFSTIAAVFVLFSSSSNAFQLNLKSTPSMLQAMSLPSMRLQATQMASQMGRREVVSTAAAATLASILTVPNLAGAEIPGIAGQSPKTILITGASSGIGFDAVSRFVSLGHTVHVPCRNLEKSNSIKDRLSSMSDLPGTCVTGVCDLSDLNSIQQYANNLKSSNVKLDAVCLNAGLAPGISNKIARRTKQVRSASVQSCLWKSMF